MKKMILLTATTAIAIAYENTMAANIKGGLLSEIRTGIILKKASDRQL